MNASTNPELLAVEEQRPQTLPREFVHAYCSRCDTNEPSPGPATAAAAQVQFMQNLANGAEVMTALRNACAQIETWAAYAFRMKGQTQAEFEKVWSLEDGADYRKWCELKRVAGLALTDLDPQPTWCGDE